MKKIFLFGLLVISFFVFGIQSVSAQYDILKPVSIENDPDVKYVKPVGHQKRSSVQIGNDLEILGTAGIYDTLTWRNEGASTMVNYGFLNHGDSMLVWLNPQAACSLIAIRFQPNNYQGNLLLDIWDASHYDPLIYSTDSTDANGWWGTFEPINDPSGWIPGDIVGHSPLGWGALDPDHHHWGPFPFTVTSDHVNVWIEIPAAYGLQGEVDLGGEPFYIGANFYMSGGWGFNSQYDWTTPYNFFKFYAAGQGPGPHDGRGASSGEPTEGRD